VRPATLTAGLAGLLAAGCGAAASRTPRSALPAALVREARPIGHGPRFHPPDRGPVLGRCRSSLGRRYEVHVEVFAANRVLLLASGIGTRPPRTRAEGRITRAGCYGALVTLEPTGVVLVRPGSGLRLAALFRSWGQPLAERRLASFRASRPRSVQVFVGGRRWRGSPGRVPLRPRAEIVLEIGPYVPPHASYDFPPAGVTASTAPERGDFRA
jgi:hypothetical protein